MNDHHAIRLALRKQLLTVSGLPAAKQWENQTFTPPTDGSPWLRETLLPAGEQFVASSMWEATGLVQYDLMYPMGDSIEDPDALADAVSQVFRPPKTIGSATKVIIDRAERGAGQVTDNVWYMLSVRIRWRAYAYS